MMKSKLQIQKKDLQEKCQRFVAFMDIILIAPQVAYMLPQAKRRLPDKEVVTIPTRIFATNDYSGALKIIYDWYQNKEEK